MALFEWQTSFKRYFEPNQDENLDSYYWVHVVSENVQRPFLNKRFNMLKTPQFQMNYKDAHQKITMYNQKQSQQRMTWRIPELDILFHFFQLKTFTENFPGFLLSQLPNSNNRMRFWSSSVSFDGLHWAVVIQIHHVTKIGETNYRSMDYQLTFETIQQDENAYLMAVLSDGIN